MRADVKVLCVGNDPADREAIAGYTDILGWQVKFATADTAVAAATDGAGIDVIYVESTSMTHHQTAGVLRTLRQARPITPIVLVADHMPVEMVGVQEVAVDAVVRPGMLFTVFKDQVKRLAAR